MHQKVWRLGSPGPSWELSENMLPILHMHRHHKYWQKDLSWLGPCLNHSAMEDRQKIHVRVGTGSILARSGWSRISPPDPAVWPTFWTANVKSTDLQVIEVKNNFSQWFTSLSRDCFVVWNLLCCICYAITYWSHLATPGKYLLFRTISGLTWLDHHVIITSGSGRVGLQFKH